MRLRNYLAAAMVDLRWSLDFRTRLRDEHMQPERPFITVGVACFNAENTIARAIDSAMKLGADAGAIPAKLLENMRPTVIAGFAKLAELVKK